MGSNCEEIRHLLVELEYEELGEIDEQAVLAHVAQCDECSERQTAYRAVRADLQSWDRVEPQRSRIAFVPMNVAAGGLAPGQLAAVGGWRRGLSIAASFVLGVFLTAAVANTRITKGDDGWSFSTSLLPQAVGSSGSSPVASRNPAQSQPTTVGSSPSQNNPGQRALPQTASNGMDPAFVSLSPEAIDSRIDARLQARGMVQSGATPVGNAYDASLTPIVERVLVERYSRLIDNKLGASEQRRQAELYQLQQAVDGQLLLLLSELGLLQEGFGERLEQQNVAIDYLFNQVNASATPRQVPEQQ